MEKYFQLESGKKVNIVEHTLEQIQKWPHLHVRIGTDSQNYSNGRIPITRYVTSIVYVYGKRGAHCIYFLEEVARVKSHYNRLYGEGLRTMEANDLLITEIPIAVEALEFDFADVQKTISSQLVSVFKGWALGNAVFKSGDMIACKYSDHICRQ